MDQFLLEFSDLNLRKDETQREASLKKRICWVVKDRAKFSNLIQELSEFIGKFNAVMPAVHEPIEVVTRKHLDKILHLRQLQLVQEAARGHEEDVADLAQELITQRCQKRVLDRLWYRTMDQRHQRVAKAHSQTLDWALYPPEAEAEWDDLAEWLRSGSGVYWIQGKAGSGKSTLMKYLYQHPEIRRMLQTWAAGSILIMPNFFLWHLGTFEQRSHAGLTRSLLYYVLKADPSLIPRMLPRIWEEAHQTETADLELPSSVEVEEAFSVFQSETTNGRFCCFIDGLDEYAGNLTTATAFINSLASSANVKVVVSSRPVPACVQAFSRRPQLRLQDLTREDIRIYVDDTVRSHPHVQSLMSMEPGAMQETLEDLVDRSSGVFLWVVLACQSLLDGFAAFDYPHELRRRVDELPPELESLFKHMLDKIEPRYQVQAAKLLRLRYQWRVNSLNSETLQLTELTDQRRGKLSEGVYTLGLALVEESDFKTRPISDFRPLSLEEKQMKCKMLEARMRSRCCGLMEVQRPKVRKNSRFCFCRERNGKTVCDDLVDSTIEFIHRSVFEFLSMTEVWDLTCLQIDDEFDANAVLSSMNLHLAHVSATCPQRSNAQVNGLTTKALVCAQAAGETSSEATGSALYNFSRMIFELIKILCGTKKPTNEDDSADENHSPTSLHHSFEEIQKTMQPSEKAEAQLALILAVELGMTDVVENMSTWDMLSEAQQKSLLWHAIDMPYSSSILGLRPDTSPVMITFLLSKGFDPNMTFYHATTPWTIWLRRLKTLATDKSLQVAIEVTRIFLRAGADTSVTISGSPVEKLIKDLLDSWISEDQLFTTHARSLATQYTEIIETVARERRLLDQKNSSNTALLTHNPGSKPARAGPPSVRRPSPSVVENCNIESQRKRSLTSSQESQDYRHASENGLMGRASKRPRMGEND